MNYEYQTTHETSEKTMTHHMSAGYKVLVDFKNREVTSVTSFAVDGKRYPVRTVSRETLILNAASTQADLVEWACDDIAERETHHMCDD